MLRWWMVANPRIWTWEQLFTAGFVRFRHGRLKRNFKTVAVGDLVVGYASAPHNRLAAVALVSAVDLGSPEPIELRPLARLNAGPRYSDLLKHPVLANSEPIRCRNQGILFALRPEDSTAIQQLVLSEYRVGDRPTF